MATDAYMYFAPYQGNPLVSESQVQIVGDDKILGGSLKTYASSHYLFEVEDYSFDIEQTLNIGSQSSGAGAGKVSFNPFSITRKIDCSSPMLFDMACAGSAFKLVQLFLRKSTGDGVQSGGAQAGYTFLRFDFKLVAVKTISWAHDEESPKETTTFEYGGLQIHYAQQNADGTMQAEKVGGWNRVNNKQDHTPNPI